MLIKPQSEWGCLDVVYNSYQTQNPASSPYYRLVVSRLVVLRGSLASLELLQVPVADLHVTVLLVHAAGELGRGTGAVVVSLVPLAGLIVLGDRRGVGLRGGGLGRRAATEEAADGMADGGADSYTSSCASHLAEETRALGSSGLGSGSVLLGSSHGGRRALLLGSRSRGSGCRARRGAGGRRTATG